MNSKKIAVLWLCLMIIFSCIVIIIEVPTPVLAGTIWVDDNYPSEDATHKKTIQAAIDNASVGDTVYVYNGTYYENIIIDITINLTGEDRNNTIIDGGGSGDVVHISKDFVNITGFTVKNSGGLTSPSYDSGIDIRSNNNIITDNIVTDSNYGICLYQTSTNYINENNIFSTIWGGILLDSSSINNITSNNISSNNWAGIAVNSLSNNNIVKKNNVNGNKYGIQVTWDSNNNNIIDNIATNNSDTGIYVYRTESNNMINNNVSNNTLYGIYLFDSINSNISGNHFDYNGVFIEGDVLSHFNTHEILSNNIVNGKLLYYDKDCNGLNIDGTSVGQIILANCSDVDIRNLSIHNTDVGIEVAYSTNMTISYNNISSNNKDAIYLYELSNSEILQNSLMNNNYFGIYLASSSNNTIMKNNASNNLGGILVIFSSHNNTVIRNNVYLSENYGIYVGGDSIDNLVINNNISSGNKYGIWLSSASNNNITNNDAIKNDIGIFIWNSPNNNIISNYLWNNDEGVKLQSSLNNWIYHNNFINNANQASDDSSNNNWDINYPSGGNYWSDWTTPDNYNGSVTPQTTGSPDGIVDNPRLIDGGSNQDNYPLVAPIGNAILLYPGWNIISIPFIQSENSLDIVLSSISDSYDAVQWYNISDTSNHWKHNHTSKPHYMNDLNQINHTMGFWIHIIEPGEILFRYLGVKSTQNQTINLDKGWNLVGYPSLYNQNRTKALNNINFSSEVDAIWTYNATTQTWKEITASDNFEVGRGYWMHSKVTKTWIVPL